MQQCLLLKRNVNGDTRPLVPACIPWWVRYLSLHWDGNADAVADGCKARSPHKEIRRQSFSLLGAH